MVLCAEDALRIDEKLFLFAKNLNMLFSIDIQYGTIEFLEGIPEEKAFSEGMTCKLVYWKKQIIVVPLKAKKIWIYSLKDRIWNDITIRGFKSDVVVSNFRQAIIYQNSLFLFGGHYPAILKMDLNSYEISYIEEPFLRFRDNKKEKKELYFRGDFVYKDDVLYLASSRENLVLKIYLDSEIFEWVEVGEKGNRYSGIMWDGENYWIAPRKNTSIVKWDGKSRVEEYKIPIEKRKNKISYAGILEKNNCIVIPALSQSGAETIIISKEGKMKFDEKEYMFYKRTEWGEYLFQNTDGRLIYIDNSGKKRQFECNINGKLFYKLMDALDGKEYNFTEKLFFENMFLSFDELLYLLNKKYFSLILEEKNIGLQIWERIKDRNG